MCVCHWLRFFIGGEEQMALQRFSCLAHAGFECDICLGTLVVNRTSFSKRLGGAACTIMEKGRGTPLSYIPSVEREVLDLGQLKQASSEKGPPSAVNKEGILWCFFCDFRARTTPRIATEVTRWHGEPGGHVICDGRGGTAALRGAEVVWQDLSPPYTAEVYLPVTYG